MEVFNVGQLPDNRSIQVEVFSREGVEQLNSFNNRVNNRINAIVAEDGEIREIRYHPSSTTMVIFYEIIKSVSN